MNLATTALFYLLIGTAVATTMAVMNDGPVSARAFRTATAVVFWPLYLPMFMQDGSPVRKAQSAPMPLDDKSDLGRAITQVEEELDLALQGLDGWSDSVLAREQDRFTELRTAWRVQAGRIAELDQLLAQPSFRESGEPRMPLKPSEAARHGNIQRLQAIRRRLHEELVGTLAKVRELATMIHLAKYTGAPASRTADLVAQIAATIAGMSEVAEWQEETAPVHV